MIFFNQTSKDIYLLIIFALIGYIFFFFGSSFFVHQDQSLISNFSYGNSIGNGWRPDKGFGMPFFYGDSSWHPWSPYSFFEKLFPNNSNNYNDISFGSSIILIFEVWLASLLQRGVLYYLDLHRMEESCPSSCSLY